MKYFVFSLFLFYSVAINGTQNRSLQSTAQDLKNLVQYSANANFTLNAVLALLFLGIGTYAAFENQPLGTASFGVISNMCIAGFQFYIHKRLARINTQSLPL